MKGFLMDKSARKLVELATRRREQLGLSLRGLSEVVGISFATLSRLEKGSTEPDDTTKARLANWLGSDATKAGIHLEHVAEVHFRAAKNIENKAVGSLLKLAEHLKKTRSK
jgi:transcriptional regulator with XRE-family HTH domain